MTVRTVATFDEWASYAAQTDEPRAQAVGELADQIRGRFGANKHVPVLLSGEVEYTGCADGCCNDTYRWFNVECGDHSKQLEYSYTDARIRYADWLDEPRRQAEREAAERAKAEQQKVNAAAFQTGVVQPITDAMQQAEADGYTSAGEWHDQVMDRLGIGGVRYGRE
ncbi:hypothetical protein [Nocardia asiatica]|uniref:hypothetical protein n=1 Tax=Nocardia asiatica TaxID=209252 RepID=UPI0024583D2F|nr:hypothetical protein [Nocardia asiatica]